MLLPLARPFAACVLAAALAAPPAAAQRTEPPVRPGSPTPGWAREGGMLAANVVLSGVMGGVAQELRGGSFRDGFARAAAGGVAVYAGKRIAAERFAGAGLLGREVAAVGSSVVWNAGAGVPSLSRLMFPVGPVHVYVTPAGRRSVRLKADAAAVVAVVRGFAAPELEWDARRSLSAGSMVFVAPRHRLRFMDGEAYNGAAFPGTMYVAGRSHEGYDVGQTVAHEQIHVLQLDQLFMAWGEHAERGLAGRIPGGAAVHRYLDVGVSALTLGLGAALIREHGTRPWEVEANLLTGTE